MWGVKWSGGRTDGLSNVGSGHDQDVLAVLELVELGQESVHYLSRREEIGEGDSSADTSTPIFDCKGKGGDGSPASHRSVPSHCSLHEQPSAIRPRLLDEE
jgi:hypothetical protein